MRKVYGGDIVCPGETRFAINYIWPRGWKTHVWPCILGESSKGSVNLWGAIHDSSHRWFKSCSNNVIYAQVDSSDEGEPYLT